LELPPESYRGRCPAPLLEGVSTRGTSPTPLGGAAGALLVILFIAPEASRLASAIKTEPSFESARLADRRGHPTQIVPLTLFANAKLEFTLAPGMGLEAGACVWGQENLRCTEPNEILRKQPSPAERPSWRTRNGCDLSSRSMRPPAFITT
jgi:hypothetical protein